MASELFLLAIFMFINLDMTYKDQLKTPKWQRKRLEIMSRDGFQCQCCFSRFKTLVVHHKWYTKGLSPWDYINPCYITLCKDCHDLFHDEYEEFYKIQYADKSIIPTDVFLFYMHYDRLIKTQGNVGICQLDQIIKSMIINEDQF